jgi:probable F420-dependent oxidoreductase
MTPFFNPGPIEHPEIPIFIAGVNTRLARLSGEVCDGFHVHPFHSPEYVRKVVEPAISEGAEGVGRDPAQVELATSAFVISAESEERVTEQRESVRAQISFYASTPTYRTVLEAHGWEEVGDRLNALAREKKWREMPALVSDEMLATYATEAAPDELGATLKERYDGLIDRVALYLPFVPGERDEFWRTVVGSATA